MKTKNIAVIVVAFIFACWGTVSYAQVEPGLGLVADFGTIASGTGIKLASQADLSLKPDFAWILDRQSQMVFQGNIRSLNLAEPEGVVVLQNKSLLLLGANLNFVGGFGHFIYHVGLEGAQTPVLDARNWKDLKVAKQFMVWVPVGLSYKLIMLESQLLKIGAGAGAALPISSAVTSGNRFNAHLNYEVRGSTKVEMTFFYETSLMGATVGNQTDVVLGIGLHLGFPGRRGFTPPPDELE